MSGKSKIEWTEHTWNPVVGCSILSPGCTNCYAMKMAARIEAMSAGLPAGHASGVHYRGTTKRVNGNAVWTGKLALAPERTLLAPLRRKIPTIYFVNSMGDLFHENAPDEWIDKVFAVMALSPQHTFQVLTKRAERMRAYLARQSQPGPEGDEAPAVNIRIRMTAHHAPPGKWARQIAWPLPNVWLGVSAERQQEADERISHLLDTPAAIRFVSAEPLLGPIDFTNHDPSGIQQKMQAHGWSSIWKGNAIGRACLDWVIVGGESGPGARPMHPDWVRSIREQCAAAGVAMFFKQWGANEPHEFARVGKDGEIWRRTPSGKEHRFFDEINKQPGDFQGVRFSAVGKKAAGRLLDGREHNDMPALPRLQQDAAA